MARIIGSATWRTKFSVSISIAAAMAEASERLRAAGISEPRREAGSLMSHALQKDRTHIITHGDSLLDDAQWNTFQDGVIRRAAREPLQYITGHQYFFGLDFAVTPDVLIPRPETEVLVESAIELMDGAGAS